MKFIENLTINLIYYPLMRPILYENKGVGYFRGKKIGYFMAKRDTLTIFHFGTNAAV